MKKILKIFFIVIMTLIILIGGFLFSPLLSISARRGIEYSGSKILHTQVTVDDVKIDILKGDVFISGLTVGSPEGFEEPYVFKLDKIAVDANMKSLRSDVIVINSIIVDAPNIIIEDMGANLKALTKNLEKPAPREEGTSSPKVEKKLVISDFLLTNANVKLMEGVEVKIPDIRLQNIGTQDKAASVKDFISKVLNVVSKESLQAVTEFGKESVKKTFRSFFD